MNPQTGRHSQNPMLIVGRSVSEVPARIDQAEFRGAVGMSDRRVKLRVRIAQGPKHPRQSGNDHSRRNQNLASHANAPTQTGRAWSVRTASPHLETTRKQIKTAT